MKKLQFSAQILKIESKVDRTLNVKINTQELPGNEAGELYDFSGKQVWIVMAEIPITLEDLDIPDIVPEFKDEKSPSEQMRSIIYRIWEQKTDQKISFPDFYKSYMFRLNENLKKRLN